MPSAPPAIGDLRQLAALESATRTPDGAGGASLAWAQVAQVWCAVRPLTGGEHPASDRLVPSVRHEVWMRWREDVTADMRLRLGPRLLAITAVMDPDGGRRFLRLTCEEKT